MSEYDFVKKGKLVFKGDKNPLKRKKKHKKGKKEKSTNSGIDEDIAAHGGWCKAELVTEITGRIVIEFGNKTYVKALDNGYFTICAPHEDGEAPMEEEILTAVNINETKVAFKSGYNKYMSYDKNSCVVAKSDAIGPLEHWEPVFQDGKLALLGSNGCFMSVRDSDDTIVATSKKASTNEIVNIRFEAKIKEVDPLQDVPLEERGDIEDVEVNYVRKFQKFQDKKLRVNKDGHVELKKAKTEGILHEVMLDRRSKMKADRYCK